MEAQKPQCNVLCATAGSPRSPSTSTLPIISLLLPHQSPPPSESCSASTPPSLHTRRSAQPRPSPAGRPPSPLHRTPLSPLRFASNATQRAGSSSVPATVAATSSPSLVTRATVTVAARVRNATGCPPASCGLPAADVPTHTASYRVAGRSPATRKNSAPPRSQPRQMPTLHVAAAVVHAQRRRVHRLLRQLRATPHRRAHRRVHRHHHARRARLQHLVRQAEGLRLCGRWRVARRERCVGVAAENRLGTMEQRRVVVERRVVERVRYVERPGVLGIGKRVMEKRTHRSSVPVCAQEVCFPGQQLELLLAPHVQLIEHDLTVPVLVTVSLGSSVRSSPPRSWFHETTLFGIP